MVERPRRDGQSRDRQSEGTRRGSRSRSAHSRNSRRNRYVYDPSTGAFTRASSHAHRPSCTNGDHAIHGVATWCFRIVVARLLRRQRWRTRRCGPRQRPGGRADRPALGLARASRVVRYARTASTLGEARPPALLHPRLSGPPLTTTAIRDRARRMGPDGPQVASVAGEGGWPRRLLTVPTTAPPGWRRPSRTPAQLAPAAPLARRTPPLRAPPSPGRRTAPSRPPAAARQAPGRARPGR